MSAPATNGVLRTKLSDMKIGDYILYGRTLDTDNKTISIYQADSVTTEIDTKASESRTNSGENFYFIKVDKGMLVADRAIWVGIAYYKIVPPDPSYINKLNWFKGDKFRCMTIEEYSKIIVSSDLNGNIIPGNTSVWHSYPCANDNSGSYIIIEFLQNKADYGSAIDDRHMSFRPHNKLYTPQLCVSFTGIENGNNLTELGYRPVMEYVDNSKSTNIFY